MLCAHADWCMPQSSTHGDAEERTPAESEAFRAMLTEVNLLYLGCSVLLLVDLSYISRFWTQFEAWLSMQSATASGLKPTSADGRRCTAVPTLNATQREAQGVLEIWAEKTPHQARDLLNLPDVTVTNQRDKMVQLDKVLVLDHTIRTEMGAQLTSPMRSMES